MRAIVQLQSSGSSDTFDALLASFEKLCLGFSSFVLSVFSHISQPSLHSSCRGCPKGSLRAEQR